VARGCKKKGDAELVLALAYGATPENAALKAGLSPRTVYRRLKEPSFRERVHQVRTEMTERAAGMLTAASMGAIRTLMHLQEAATSESVRLGAARSVLELACRMRENVELTARLDALTAQLETLVGDANARDGGQSRVR